MKQYTGIKVIKGMFVAFTPTWEGPPRYDYPAACTDLLYRLGEDRADAQFARIDRWNKKLASGAKS